MQILLKVEETTGNKYSYCTEEENIPHPKVMGVLFKIGILKPPMSAPPKRTVQPEWNQDCLISHFPGVVNMSPVNHALDLLLVQLTHCPQGSQFRDTMRARMQTHKPALTQLSCQYVTQQPLSSYGVLINRTIQINQLLPH